MKLRAQPKMVNGKPRWYLVSSYRDQKDKTPRTRHHLYLGVPPDAKLKKLIARINEAQKYGIQFHTGKEFQKIREISLRLREEEKWRLRRIKLHEEKAEEKRSNAPKRHLERLRQRRELYALKKTLRPGERLISPRNQNQYLTLLSKLWLVRVEMTRGMRREYGSPEDWRPELKDKVSREFAWVEEFQNALDGLGDLRLNRRVEKRLSLEKAGKIDSFAVVVSRLKAAKEALKDMIQVKGQPQLWSARVRDSFRYELRKVIGILAILKAHHVAPTFV